MDDEIKEVTVYENQREIVAALCKIRVTQSKIEKLLPSKIKETSSKLSLINLKTRMRNCINLKTRMRNCI